MANDEAPLQPPSASANITILLFLCTRRSIFCHQTHNCTCRHCFHVIFGSSHFTLLHLLLLFVDTKNTALSIVIELEIPPHSWIRYWSKTISEARAKELVVSSRAEFEPRCNIFTTHDKSFWTREERNVNHGSVKCCHFNTHTKVKMVNDHHPLSLIQSLFSSTRLLIILCWPKHPLELLASVTAWN